VREMGDAIGFKQQLHEHNIVWSIWAGEWRLWRVILCTLEQRMEVSHEISRADRYCSIEKISTL